MTYRQLDSKILEFLKKKTGRATKTLRNDISKLRSDFPGVPINSVAHIYARQNETSVLAKLTKEEKEKVPNVEIPKPRKIIVKSNQKKQKTIQYIRFQSSNKFINGHIDETNRAYSCKCYTAAYILIRKILENLITDIIRQKFPPNKKKENLEMYYDIDQRRTKDFSIILKNFNKKSFSFAPDDVLVTRIVTLCKKFKDDANDKTHSWYHLVSKKKELDDKNPQYILDLIEQLEKNL